MIKDQQLFEKDKALYSIFHTAEVWSDSACEELEPHSHSILRKFNKDMEKAEEIVNIMTDLEISYLISILIEDIRGCEEEGHLELLKAHNKALALLTASQKKCG